MTMQAKLPDNLTKYVNPDGTLSRDGILLLQRIVRSLEALDARLTALEP